MNIKQALAKASAHAPQVPLTEIKALLCLALNQPRAWLIAHDSDELGDCMPFDALMARRVAGEPMAYLHGKQEFYGRDFIVNSDVLIPRPETEHLIEASKVLLTPGAHVLDLCTGSGIIATTLSCEYPKAHYTASDISAPALSIAVQNAKLHLADVRYVLSDLFENIEGQYDLITCNPPYIADADHHLSALKYEPRLALSDAADGLSFYRRMALEAPQFLRQHAYLIVEHGYDQSLVIKQLFQTKDWASFTPFMDLAGHTRGAIIRRI